MGVWLGGWGQSDIKDHPSPAKARVGAELGNSGVTIPLAFPEGFGIKKMYHLINMLNLW